jgi:hypothetical protein
MADAIDYKPVDRLGHIDGMAAGDGNSRRGADLSSSVEDLTFIVRHLNNGFVEPYSVTLANTYDGTPSRI